MNFQGKETSNKLFTGLVEASPIAVNPSQEEATELGLGNVMDYVYTKDDGTQVGRIVLYVKLNLETPTTKRLIFDISNKEYESASGNKVFINNKLQFKFKKTIEEVLEDNMNADEEWKKVKEEGLRASKEGELGLLRVILAISNWKQNNATFNMAFTKEDIEQIVSGDAREIRDVILNKFKGHKFYVLLGVDEEKDQIAVFQSANGVLSPFLSVSDRRNKRILKKLYDGVTHSEYGWNKNIQYTKYANIEDDDERVAKTFELQEFTDIDDESFV